MLLFRLVIQPLWRALLAAADRFTDPPIMRQRINAGSDHYFAWRERHEGDSEVDEVLGADRHQASGE